MGKIIYKPKGAALEYSQYAANFYVGCMGKNSCKYCYCPGILRGYWPDTPTLKKSLQNETKAFEIFCKEVKGNLTELQKHGLFFNFVSDPCLRETIELNFNAMKYCCENNILVKLLTKQTWWVQNLPLWIINYKHLISIGFTLTGCDDQEPGAATNQERIEAGDKLKKAGFKVWYSIEPIIDLGTSWMCIIQTAHICDLYKIGLQSSKKYDILELVQFIINVLRITKNEFRNIPVYFKDSLLKQAGISRESLPENCVTRDFNL